MATLVMLQFSVSFPAVADAPSDEAEALQLLKQAEHYVEIHNAAKALPLLEQLLFTYPETSSVPWAKLRIVDCYHQQNQFDVAVQKATDLVQQYPETPLAAWAQFSIGAALAAKGTEDYRAVAELIKVVDEYTNLTDDGPIKQARVKLGEVVYRISLYDPAFANADKFMGTQTDNPRRKARALALQAAVYAQMNKFTEAIDQYDQLVKMYPDQNKEVSRAAYDLAKRYLEFLGNQPANDKRHPKYARIVDATKELLAAPARLTPEETSLVAASQLELGRFIFDFEKDLLSAEPHFRMVVEKGWNTPYAPQAAYYLAQCLVQKQDFTSAVSLLDPFAEAYPNSGYVSAARIALSECYYALGQEENALETLDELSKSAEQAWRPVAHEKAAQVLLSLGRDRDAAERFQTAAMALREQAVTHPEFGTELRDATLQKASQLEQGATEITKSRETDR